MIVDENVSGFIDSLCKDGESFMEDLRARCEETGVPVIRRQSEGFIKSLLLMNKPENILEIGTGAAYSAIFMAKTLPESRIITIENYKPRILQAKENIKKAGLEDRICLIEADAQAALEEFFLPFDFIFLDGPKGQYKNFLPELIRLLKKGGILLCDNVLQEGSIAASRFALERRQRTIHERLREFLYEISHSSELETCVLSVADGMSLSIKL